jgi:hypothetical protein
VNFTISIFKQWSTFQSEVVILQIWEVLGAVGVQQSKPKRTKSVQVSDFEKNARELRSKERKLNPQSPVPPIKHRP